VQVKQFFMADPSQESAMLQAVRDAMQAGDGLVTFNGKSYDVPLLQSRMILNRIAWKSADFLHLDLMHACRRLWRPFAADGRLQSMEQTVLALYRENDIAGELIPALYFDSVRQRNPSALKPVFQHNVLDLISMARLLVKAGQVFAKPTAETLFHRIGVARTYEHLGRFEQACAVCMPQESMTADEKYQILLRHARNLKRLQRYDEAAHVLTKLVNESSRFLVEPYIELIKLYEHRLLDLSMALQFTQRALQNIAVVSELDDRADWEIIQQAMAHRMGRIQSKLKRMNEKGTQSD
jgi:tetratricopeptide (TPR) repeat protein